MNFTCPRAFAPPDFCRTPTESPIEATLSKVAGTTFPSRTSAWPNEE